MISESGLTTFVLSNLREAQNSIIVTSISTENIYIQTLFWDTQALKALSCFAEVLTRPRGVRIHNAKPRTKFVIPDLELFTVMEENEVSNVVSNCDGSSIKLVRVNKT